MVNWGRHPWVEWLLAGWPCQGNSVAGKQLGSLDPRHLWPWVAKCVRAVRPRVVFGENVANLLSIEKGALFGQTLADLGAAGYTVAWMTVGACRVGLAHHRHRVFVYAVLGGERLAGEGMFGSPPPRGGWPAAGVYQDGQWWPMPAETCVAQSGVRMMPTPTAKLGDPRRGFPSPAVASDRMADGRRNLDDAVALLPTPTFRDGNRGAGWGGESGRPLSETVHRLLPTPRATDGTKGGPNQRGTSGDLMLPSLAPLLMPTPTVRDGTAGPARRDRGRSNGPNLRDIVARDALMPTPRVAAKRTSRKAATAEGSRSAPSIEQALEIMRGDTPREIIDCDNPPAAWRDVNYNAALIRHAAIVGRPAPDPTVPGRTGQPRLSARFVEWLMGIPQGWVTDVFDYHQPTLNTHALGVLGNGVVPVQAAYALAVLSGWVR